MIGLDDEQKHFFSENGYLILRGAVGAEELAQLQRATAELIGRSAGRVLPEIDYRYSAGHVSGEQVLHRIEYVIDKSDECKVLLANPNILAAVEDLIGADLVPTWDSMVLKLPGEGVLVPWHRDAAPDTAGDTPIFNVDFYLDEADSNTSVRVIPGSHLWPTEQVSAWLSEYGAAATPEDFDRAGGVSASMQPGDVLFHNILVLHGSPRNTSDKLRRVVYYEFRPAHTLAKLGPHKPEYVPAKQKVLQACIYRRTKCSYLPPEETPYLYHPPAPFNRTRLTPGEEPPSYRHPHEEYWRPTSWEPKTSFDLTPVVGCRVSPSGSSSVVVSNRYIMEEETSEQRTRLWLTTQNGLKPISSDDVSSGNPRWSPDGNWIAFNSKRGDKSAIYAISAAGGEAAKLTDIKTDVGDFRWSPDGEWIAFTSGDGPTEPEEKRKKAKDDWRWVDEDLKFNRLMAVPFQPDSAGKREAITLSPAGMHVTGFNWSPDGKELAFEHAPHPLADYWPKTAISRLNFSTLEVTTLYCGERAAFAPWYSRDGSTIAFMISSDPPRWTFDAQITLIPREGGTIQTLDVSPNRNPGILGWSTDDSAVLFVEPLNTGFGVYSANRTTGQVTLLYRPEGALMEIELNAPGTHFGMALQTPTTPSEAVVVPIDGFQAQKVSSFFESAPFAMPPVGKTEVLRWLSPDGTEIEGLLTYPVGYTAGQRVPLLVFIHGGPAGVYQQTFTGNASVYPFAAFNSKGYAVLRCNPRGSSGYGEPFRSANRKDWGGGDYQDIMSGVDKVIDMGIADPDRMGVMGWSYGGFMTSWIVTQTNRFKAASVGAGVTNLMSFNGTADIPSFIPDYFGAQSWENLELYRDHSAMFQVGSVKTPTLVVHGESDIRVPISQGYEFYNALKQQGIETRMLVLPRQPHGPNEPKMMLKCMEAHLEWFEKYLKA